MKTKLSKSLLILSCGLFFLLVVINNLFDYSSNLGFVQHVLQMDTTFPSNSMLWRSITSDFLHHSFYWAIILWEAIICVLCFKSGYKLYKSRSINSNFQKAKDGANCALVLGLLLWFTAFITIGGEWFLMWQSKIWNGQDSAFRMFSIMGIILIYLNQEEIEN